MSPHSILPHVAPQPRLSDFFQGLGLLGRAFSLILRDRRLLLLSALCAAVTAVALVGLVWLLWTYAPGALGSVWTRPESWYGRAAWSTVLVLSSLVLWVVGANVVPPLLLSPLQDPLSELTEEALAQARDVYGGEARSPLVVKHHEDALGEEISATGFPASLI